EPQMTDSLSQLIGHEASCALAEIYGGDRIEIPNPPPRRVRILELRASGVSIDVIARTLHCTRRRVFQVMADASALVGAGRHRRQDANKPPSTGTLTPVMYDAWSEQSHATVA